MHHAYVKCNYSPYSSFWDRVFGTFKHFEVKKSPPPKGATPTPKAPTPTPTTVDLVYEDAPPSDKATAVAPPLRSRTGGGPTMLFMSGETPITSASPVAATVAIFSRIFHVGPGSPDGIEGKPTSDDLTLEREFERISQRIWSEHHRKLGTPASIPPYEESSAVVRSTIGAARSTDKDSVAEGGGEEQVVTRGLAYTIAGGVNLMVFVGYLAVSMHMDASAF